MLGIVQHHGRRSGTYHNKWFICGSPLNKMRLLFRPQDVSKLSLPSYQVPSIGQPAHMFGSGSSSFTNSGRCAIVCTKHGCGFNRKPISNHFAMRSRSYRLYSNRDTSDRSDESNGNNVEHHNTIRYIDASPINQRAAKEILKQLSSPPNILTLSRIMATPYLSYLLISHHHEKVTLALADSGPSTTIDSTTVDATTNSVTDVLCAASANIDPTSAPVVALTLFLIMGFTDFLDGYIARKFDYTTVLGTYLDPFADKVFISIMSMTLWYTETLPGVLVGLWVVRDVGVFSSAYWMVRSETLKKKGTINSEDSIAIMDPSKTPLKVEANFLSKVNTALQISLIAMGIAGEVPAVDIPSELMTSLCWLTAGTTIVSTAMYLDGSSMMKSGNKDSQN